MMIGCARKTVSAFIISLLPYIAGCSCSGDAKCPPDKSAWCDSFGKWQCWSKDSGRERGTKPIETIGGIGAHLKNGDDFNCFGEQLYTLYNQNDFDVRVVLMATPLPPGWSSNGMKDFDVPAKTPFESGVEVGQTKYRSVDDCAYINYRVVSVERLTK